MSPEMCAIPWGAQQLQALSPQPSAGKKEMLHPHLTDGETEAWRHGLFKNLRTAFLPNAQAQEH